MEKKTKKKVKPKVKPINWSKALAKALEQEQTRDMLKAVDLIRQLYWLVCIKHTNKKN